MPTPSVLFCKLDRERTPIRVRVRGKKEFKKLLELALSWWHEDIKSRGAYIYPVALSSDLEKSQSWGGKLGRDLSTYLQFAFPAVEKDYTPEYSCLCPIPDNVCQAVGIPVVAPYRD